MNKSKLNKSSMLLFDKQFFYLVLSLVVVGLIFVADISAPQALNFFNDKFHFLKSQIIAAFIGVIIMYLVSFINYSFYKKIASPLFVLSTLLLILVFIPGLSYEALGARRWINIGSLNFQPSEVVKLALAIYLAKLADLGKKPIAFYVPVVVVVGLIMLQPDLGTTLVISVMALSQIFVSGIPILYFLGSLVVGLIGVISLILISPYRRDRLMTFFENTVDPLGKSYHIRQVLLALGSGGLFGVGLGQSRQKYLFLPEASSDSIFAAIAEELGFLGSFVLILIFAFFVYKAFMIAKSAPDMFAKILAVGISAWIGGQIIINISSMVALSPLTGIPLPFFSYGGTSLVMVLLGCGILLNISRYGTKKVVDHRKSRRYYS